MRNSTDFTRDILTNTKHSDITPSDNFVPFLVQKYISGVSPEHCNLINSILNIRLSQWRDPQEIYDFLKCFIPKKPNAQFKYFGKSVDKKASKIDLESISNSMEISMRELNEMIKYFPEIETQFIESKEKILKSKK